MTTHSRTFKLIIVVLALLLSADAVYAWSNPPSGTPPTCPSGQPGCDAPLNVSGSFQSKDGNLMVNAGNGYAVGFSVPYGKVGIGTASPDGKLTINGAGGELQFSGMTTKGGLWSNGISKMYLADWATGTKGLIVDVSNGNVGIGTASPGYKLDVNGSINATSILVNGVAISGSNGTINFNMLQPSTGNSPNAGYSHYGIYEEPGLWNGGAVRGYPYPDLVLAYHTGMSYVAYYGYGGHRFYTGYTGDATPTTLSFSVGEGDGNTRVYGNLYVSGAAYASSGQALCQVNGVNCPAASAPTWGSITGKPTAITQINNHTGTYTSLDIAGSNSGYAGINFSDYGYRLMVRSDGLSGIYSESTGWKWYFDNNGVLTTGTVPASAVTGLSSVSVSYATNAGALNGVGMSGPHPYYHLGSWGVGRTAAGAVLVNSAYRADYADSAGSAPANGGTAAALSQSGYYVNPASSSYLAYLQVAGGSLLANWPGYPAGIQQTNGNYIYPGFLSGQGSGWNTSYYLAGSTSWGLYSNTSLNAQGLYDVGNRVYSAINPPPSVNSATYSTYINTDAYNMKLHWSGQGGQPTWLWGSNNGADAYVWNPSNFSVNYANSAGSANSVNCNSALCWNSWNYGNYYQTNGDIYMAWAGNWLSTVLSQKQAAGSYVPGDTWWGSTYYGSNGNVYLGWLGTWLSTKLDALTNGYASSAGYATGAGYADNAGYASSAGYSYSSTAHQNSCYWMDTTNNWAVCASGYYVAGGGCLKNNGTSWCDASYSYCCAL